MSNSPDPCYCEQSQLYEAILIAMIETVEARYRRPKNKAVQAKLDELVQDAKDVISEYRKALKEYET